MKSEKPGPKTGSPDSLSTLQKITLTPISLFGAAGSGAREQAEPGQRAGEDAIYK
jgi:hypothetical protein